MKIKNYLMALIAGISITNSSEVLPKEEKLENILGNAKTIQHETKKQNNPLFEKLKEVKGLHISQENEYNPDKNTILLYKDIHSNSDSENYKFDLRQLEKVREKTGIDNIAIEGLAKTNKNKFQIIAGEKKLLEILLKDDNYKVTPLEDKKLCKTTLIGNSLSLIGVTTPVDVYNFINFGYIMVAHESLKDKDKLKFQKLIKKYDEYMKYFTNEDNTEIKNKVISMIHDETLKENYNKLEDNLENINEIFGESIEIKSYFDIAKHYFQLEEELGEKYFPQNHEITGFNTHKFNQDIVISARNEVAAEKYKENFSDKDGILFFGLNHAKGLKERLTDDYNIITLTPKIHSK
ncbi:MAG: hypothetical protein ACOCP4_05975 [Candidatus Woesearchaeota archaeon]